MRSLILLIGSALVLAPHAAAAKSVVPLQPMDLPFAPHRPAPLAPDHPLYQRIALDPIVGMPERYGYLLTSITSAKEMNEALRQTLARANMLAPPGVAPKARLTVQWVEVAAGAKLISFSNNATARLRYSLVRLDSGQRIFEREIRTSSYTRGGNASTRLKENARLAIVTNIASGIVCLDKAAYGLAPQDCTLTPQFRLVSYPVLRR